MEFDRRSMSRIADSLLTNHDDLVFIGDMNCCHTKSDTIKAFVNFMISLIWSKTLHVSRDQLLFVWTLFLFRIPVDCYQRWTHFALSVTFITLLEPQQNDLLSWKRLKLYTTEATKCFTESDFYGKKEHAPFHVMNIFDDVDDTAWFTSSLIKYVVDNHAPVKNKTVKFQSVPYMNSALRKAQYKRNMARNRFKRYGKSCWEENRRHRNLVVKIRKTSVRKYFEDKCSNQDRHFWKPMSPFSQTFQQWKKYSYIWKW